MDIVTISHKSKLSLSKINRAVRLETLGDSYWCGLISKEHSEALSIYVIFFFISLQFCIFKHIFHLYQEMNSEYQKSPHSYLELS